MSFVRTKFMLGLERLKNLDFCHYVHFAFQDVIVGNCVEQISLGRNSSSPNGQAAPQTRSPELLNKSFLDAKIS